MSNQQDLEQVLKDSRLEIQAYLTHYVMDRHPHRDHPANRWKYEADLADAEAVVAQFEEAVTAYVKAQMQPPVGDV